MNAPTQLNMKFELRSIVIFLRLQRFLFVKVGKILFFLRRFIKDISDQGTVEKSFRFRPEILTGFFAGILPPRAIILAGEERLT